MKLVLWGWVILGRGEVGSEGRRPRRLALLPLGVSGGGVAHGLFWAAAALVPDGVTDDGTGTMPGGKGGKTAIGFLVGGDDYSGAYLAQGRPRSQTLSRSFKWWPVVLISGLGRELTRNGASAGWMFLSGLDGWRLCICRPKTGKTGGVGPPMGPGRGPLHRGASRRRGLARFKRPLPRLENRVVQKTSGGELV